MSMERKKMKKFQTIEIINKGFFLITNGNFSKKEEKEIKKINNLENILEFLQSCKISNIIFNNHNSETEEQIFLEIFNKFLNLKNFKEIEKIEIFKNRNNSLVIYPKKNHFKFITEVVQIIFSLIIMTKILIFLIAI